MDMRAAFSRVDGADAKYLPPAFEHDKMRDRGDDRLFRPVTIRPFIRAPRKWIDPAWIFLSMDELAQREQHILAIVYPHDKDPAELPFRILHMIRFPLLVFIWFARIYNLYTHGRLDLPLKYHRPGE